MSQCKMSCNAQHARYVINLVADVVENIELKLQYQSSFSIIYFYINFIDG